MNTLMLFTADDLRTLTLKQLERNRRRESLKPLHPLVVLLAAIGGLFRCAGPCLWLDD